MTDDVVAELDRWLADWRRDFGGTPSNDMAVIRRARDEIVALRSARNECERQFQEQVAEVSRLLCQLEAVKGIAGNERKLSEAIIEQARAEAVEEAARLCECGYTTGSTASTLKAIAVAIRALKEEH